MIKRILKIAGILLILLLIVVFLLASHVVKNSINHLGPMVLGVPVSVEKVRVYLLLGHIHIEELVIGNPEGFKTDTMFNMHKLTVNFSPRSLFTDTIIVHEVLVVAPDVTYEATLSGSNIGALQKQLGGDDKPDEKKDDKKPGKKVIIERFSLTDGKVGLSLPGMMGTALPIPLPTIELTDIGKEKEGATFTEAIGAMFGAIFSTVGNVVVGAGKLIGDGAAAVGGAVVTGATAAGGAVVDGAAALGRGVSGAVGGVLNVFSGSTNADEVVEGASDE